MSLTLHPPSYNVERISWCAEAAVIVYAFQCHWWISTCGNFFPLSFFVLEWFECFVTCEYYTVTVGIDTNISGVDRSVVGSNMFVSFLFI